MASHRVAALALIIIALGALPLLAAPTPEDKSRASQRAVEKRLPFGGDRDKDRIADDLEEKLRSLGPSQSFSAIVTFSQPLTDTKLGEVRRRLGSFAVGHRYRHLPAMATRLTKRQAQVLASLPGVARVEPDRPVRAFLDGSSRWFGVTQARADFGLDGNADGLASYSNSDVVIAVLDTGIDAGHVDLDSGKVIQFVDFVRKDTAGNPTFPAPYDDHGHGTHVASIAAGEGQGDTRFKGVAPGAALVGIKVLNRRGLGITSDIDRAIEWAINNKDTFGIRVLNISLGTDVSSDGQDSTSLMVNQAQAAGLVVAVAAGNSGPGPRTIGSPAAATGALTVGAMADPSEGGFGLASFSSRGPTADGRTKPDIAAPGVQINAAAAGTSTSYGLRDGTSMAAPFVAGTAALLFHASPTLAPSQVRAVLATSGQDWGPAGQDMDYGHARLDGYRALAQVTGISGSPPPGISHRFEEGQLSGAGDADIYPVEVSDTSVPVAATMVMPTWQVIGGNRTDPDFDLYLLDPTGAQVAASTGVLRQDQVSHLPDSTGTYQLRVEAWSGTGPYFADVSAGLPPAVTLTTDGSIEFGVRDWRQTVDTTASGVSDVQTVLVQQGPADLLIKTTEWTAGTNVWELGTTSGPDQVKWEFSTDGATWQVFEIPGQLYVLSSVVGGAAQNVYFRLTTPTGSGSSAEHAVNVMVVAVSP